MDMEISKGLQAWKRILERFELSASFIEIKWFEMLLEYRENCTINIRNRIIDFIYRRFNVLLYFR